MEGEQFGNPSVSSQISLFLCSVLHKGVTDGNTYWNNSIPYMQKQLYANTFKAIKTRWSALQRRRHTPVSTQPHWNTAGKSLLCGACGRVGGPDQWSLAWSPKWAESLCFNSPAQRHKEGLCLGEEWLRRRGEVSRKSWRGMLKMVISGTRRLKNESRRSLRQGRMQIDVRRQRQMGGCGGCGERERTGRWPDGTSLPKLLTACGRNIFVIGVCSFFWMCAWSYG